MVARDIKDVAKECALLLIITSEYGHKVSTMLMDILAEWREWNWNTRLGKQVRLGGGANNVCPVQG